MSDIEGPTVLAERRDAVLMLILNRPHRLNAMTVGMAAELTDHLQRAAGDDSVRSVILTGAGRGFCAGGDLGVISEVPATVDIEAETDRLIAIQRSSQLLHEMPKPTIAAVNGPAAGAGLSWACAADLRIASESAVFRTAFLSAGLSGDFGGTWTLPRIVGAAKARELYLLNEKIRADDALRMGLVSQVVSGDLIRDTAWALGEQLAQAAPMALRLIKENLNSGLSGGFVDALAREARNQTLCSASDDCTEAATSFLEKRSPVFVGR